MYFYKDWAEAKVGVRLLAIYALALFALWLVTVGQYDPTKPNHLTVGVMTGGVAALLGYYYWRQEAARRRLGAGQVEAPAGTD